VACEGFTLEDGQENARPSFLSTKSSSLNTGMLLAHSHFYYRHRFGEQRTSQQATPPISINAVIGLG